MMRKLNCLRCDGPMHFMMRESFQKGASGAWVGNLNFSFRGGFEMEVYSCPKCGRLEFFLPCEETAERAEEALEDDFVQEDTNIAYVNKDGIPQVRCPACGKTHDFDYPKCPHCECEYH